MPRRAIRANVSQLQAGPRAPQKQPTAAHVAPPREIRRNQQPVAEDLEQRLDILHGRQAPQQHKLTIRSCEPAENPRVPLERRPVQRIIRVDRHGSDLPELLDGDRQLGRNQPAPRCDHEGPGQSLRRRSEGLRISELAPKVEATDEGIDLSQRSHALSKLDSQRELRAIAEYHSRAHASRVRRRQQENRLQTPILMGG